MNRFKQVAAATVVCAIAIPALALASSTKYSGDMDKGGTVKFTYVKEAERNVIKFKADNVKAHCDEGKARLFGHINVALPVNEAGEFEFHFSNSGDSADLEGKIKSHGRASGTWDQVLAENDGGDLHNCESGTLDWSAKKS